MVNNKEIKTKVTKEYPSKGLVFEGGKSFYVYADNKNDCFKCGYCVLSGVDYLQDGTEQTKEMPNFKDVQIGIRPKELNPILTDIPVAVNNAYGDPTLQWDNTKRKLENLIEDEHTGAVALITKGVFNKRKINNLKSYQKAGLNLIVLQSVSNLPKLIEPPSFFSRVHNLEKLSEAGIPSLPYLRPIIPNYNDNEEIIHATLKSCMTSGVKAVVYAGLMGTPDVISLLERRTSSKITPPKGYSQWQSDHKLIEKEKRVMIESIAREYGIEPFRKTSCGVSFLLDFDSDYNVHYSRPDKYGCVDCVMNDKCSDYAVEKNAKTDLNQIYKALDVIGAKGQVIVSESTGSCKLEEVCDKPCTACSISTGTKVHINGTYSLGELGLVRWLTRLTTFSDKMIDTNRMFFMYENLDREVKNDTI